MKKLMTMIAAAAMSFGLFATDATPFSISFEAEEGSTKGISEGTFTPPTGEGEWTWVGSPFALSQYTNAEKLALPYDAEGPKARRAVMFDASENDNYLPLNTSNEELTRTVGEGNMFLDQLVKFTGFEDPQTNLTAGAKIAVWMSEFWNDDETEAETNLYVTVGKVDDDGNVEPVALKIDGEYSLDTWYRLSIRSLGNVTPLTANGRAGFVIYVNGNKVSSLDADAKALISEDELTVPAKNYMKKGQLFLAIDNTNADFTKVSYKGIGAIDDIILDANGPAFMNDTTEVTFAGLAEGAVIAKVVDSDENEFDYPTEAIEVKQGQLTVTLEAAPGYKLFGKTTYTVDTADAEEGVITIDADETTFEAVVAKLNDTDDLAESELANALEELNEGDVIAIVAECSILGDEVATLYSFTPNTTITGTAGGWNIVVASYDEGVNPGNLEIGADVAADFTLNVTLEDADAGDAFAFGGNVLGTLEADAVEVTDAITVSGTLTAEALTIDETITLSGAGKVETKSPVEDGQILGEDDAEIEPVPDTPDTDWTTYRIKQAPDTVEVTFANGENSTITPLAGVSNLVVGTEIMLIATPAEDYEFAADSYEGWTKQDDGTLTQDVTIEAEATFTAPNATAIPYVAQVGNDKFLTAEAALAKVQELEANPDNFPITVTCLADQLMITFGEAPAQQSVTLAKNETIEITAGNWKFDAFSGNVVLAPGKTITAKSIADGASITTIAGYKVVKSDTTDEGGYYTWSVVEKTYVAQIGDDPTKMYETLAEAVAAAQDNDVIKLLDDYPLAKSETVVFNANVTFDLCNNTLTVAEHDEGTFAVAATKTVTFQNGTIDTNNGNDEKCNGRGINVHGTLVVKNCKMTRVGGAAPVFDIYEGTVTVGEKVVLQSAADVFRFKDEELTSMLTIAADAEIKTTGSGTGVFYNYKTNHVANITINGGEFTLASGSFFFTPANYHKATWNVTINPAAKFSSGAIEGGNAVGKIIPEGYKAKKSAGSDWYTIQAIQYATLAVDADEGITYVLTNKTTEAVVEAGYKADIDNAEVIEAVELAFEEGYELNAAASTTSVTLGTAETKTIVLKKQLKTFAVTFYGDSEKTNTLATQQVEYNGYVTPVAAPTREGFEFQGWNANTNVAIKVATDFWATWKAVTPEPTRPTPIEGGDEDQKKAYDDWKDKTAGDVTGLTDAQIVDRFVMNVPAATTDAELIAKADEELASIADVALKAIMAGEDPDLSALKEKYPNATIKLVQSDKLTSTETAKFYQLKFSFTPKNVK